MSSSRNIVYFWRNIRKKHRLSLRKEHNDSEVWYMHISPIEAIGGIVAFVLILFVAIVTLVAFTPILDYVPGYAGNRIREDMVKNIIRVDSLERKLGELQVYSHNIAVIMEGKTPFTRNVEQAGDSMKIEKPEAVAPSSADSALRKQLEGTGLYSLSGAASSARKSLQSGGELISPIKGVVANHFSPKEGRYGVGIATATSQRILAVGAGTVMLSVWTPDDGHIIQIQHADNLTSTYKHSALSLKEVGARVRAGEVIGYTGEGISGEEGKGLFEFELWYNGTPVDPESYIVF